MLLLRDHQPVFFCATTILGAAIASCVLTALLRTALSKASIQDIPNARSLHDRAVPRGGGAAIVALGLGGIAADRGFGVWWWSALAVAIVGGIDDLKSASAGLRLATHLLAAGFFCWVSQFGFLGLPFFVVFPLSALWIAWFTNLYNFMDGSDGICALHAAAVFLSCSLLSKGSFVTPLVLAGACLGFLIWNWQPAKIFMGDVGSGFLGFMAGTLCFVLGSIDPLGALILNGPFLFDATMTLIQRIRRGKSLTQAHRDHLYQRLVLSGWSHRKVALLYGGMVLLIGLPLAAFSRGAPVLEFASLLAFGFGFAVFSRRILRERR